MSIKYARRHENVIIEEIEDGAIKVKCEDDLGGWNYNPAPEVLEKLAVGDLLDVQTIQGSRVVGIAKLVDQDGQQVRQPLFWQSDDDIAADFERMRAEIDERQRRNLDAHLDTWVAQEKALPQWLRGRIQTFHDRGQGLFELEGWGYELQVAQIAEALDALAELPEDSFSLPESFDAQPCMNGATGNQVSFALMLARAHRAGEDLTGTPSALAPITGNPFYESTEEE